MHICNQQKWIKRDPVLQTTVGHKTYWYVFWPWMCPNKKSCGHCDTNPRKILHTAKKCKCECYLDSLQYCWSGVATLECLRSPPVRKSFPKIHFQRRLFVFSAQQTIKRMKNMQCAHIVHLQSFPWFWWPCKRKNELRQHLRPPGSGEQRRVSQMKTVLSSDCAPAVVVKRHDVDHHFCHPTCKHFKKGILCPRCQRRHTDLPSVVAHKYLNKVCGTDLSPEELMMDFVHHWQFCLESCNAFLKEIRSWTKNSTACPSQA